MKPASPGGRVIDLTEGELRALIREELAAARSGELLTPQEAAVVARVHVQTVRDWLRAGLPAVKAGRRSRIRRGDLDAWMQRDKSAAHLRLLGGR